MSPLVPNEGMPLPALANLLGHSDVKMTMRYYNMNKKPLTSVSAILLFFVWPFQYRSCDAQSRRGVYPLGLLLRRMPQSTLAQIDLRRFKHKSIVVLVLSLELQLEQLLLQAASHLHRPALWLDVPTFAFVGSERDDLVSQVNVSPAKVIQQAGPSGSSIPLPQ